jgi:hypothetical protein
MEHQMVMKSATRQGQMAVSTRPFSSSVSGRHAMRERSPRCLPTTAATDASAGLAYRSTT